MLILSVIYPEGRISGKIRQFRVTVGAGQHQVGNYYISRGNVANYHIWKVPTGGRSKIFGSRFSKMLRMTWKSLRKQKKFFWLGFHISLTNCFWVLKSSEMDSSTLKTPRQVKKLSYVSFLTWDTPLGYLLTRRVPLSFPESRIERRPTKT